MHVPILGRLWSPLIDFVYPPVCRICDSSLHPGETIVCSGCWDSFTLVTQEDEVWMEIGSKLTADGFVDDFFSCFLFEKKGKLQDVVHLLKYGGMRSVGVKLGREIGKRYIDRESSVPVDLVMPVPLHRRKKRERGFNQSEYLCTGFGEVTSVPVATSVLVRNKFTVSQTQLGLHERKSNVAGAFGIKRGAEELVKKKSVLLLDDVITTGSTLLVCAEVLRKAGAGKIVVASAALAQ